MWPRAAFIPLRILEKNLVLWRGHDGVPHCQDAHCLHIGAHPGYGEEVRRHGTGDTV